MASAWLLLWDSMLSIAPLAPQFSSALQAPSLLLLPSRAHTSSGMPPADAILLQLVLLSSARPHSSAAASA